MTNLNKVFFEQVGASLPAEYLISAARNPLVQKAVFAKMIKDDRIRAQSDPGDRADGLNDSNEQLRLRVAGTLAELGISRDQFELVLGITEDLIMKEAKKHAW